MSFDSVETPRTPIPTRIVIVNGRTEVHYGRKPRYAAEPMLSKRRRKKLEANKKRK